MDEETNQPIEEQCAQYLSQWKRAQADYENLQKDLSRERSQMRAHSVFSAAELFLPMYDHLVMAFTHVPTGDAVDSTMRQWILGIDLIKTQMASAIRDLGLDEIPATGSVNPQWHEVVGSEAKEGAENGTIARVVQMGYRIGERVVRPAKVCIVTNES